MIDRTQNRKLLVSVFDSQEAREAVVGGGRIVDSEDPRSALGNIKPLQIQKIARSVMDHSRDQEVQLSTNIGEDQLLFDRSEDGLAIPKSPYEIAGKAAQSALGVAISMGTNVHRCPIVKVGVDGMNVNTVGEVLSEVVDTLSASPGLSSSNVMSVLFAQDLDVWDDRKTLEPVRKGLISLGEFHHADKDDEYAFNLLEKDRLVKTLRDYSGAYLFPDSESTKNESVVIEKLANSGIFPSSAATTFVKLNELFPHSEYFPTVDPTARRTTRDVIAAMVDATANAGAHSIMLDTRIQSKVARISLTKTSGDGLIDLNRLDVKNGIPREGVLPLEDLRFFVEYCHHRKLEANLAGSFQSYQAQQVWLTIPTLDQISTRGGSSAVKIDPSGGSRGVDSRQFRATHRHLVRGLVPPEQGGVINLDGTIFEQDGAAEIIEALMSMLIGLRAEQSLPPPLFYKTDKYGKRELVNENA